MTSFFAFLSESKNPSSAFLECLGDTTLTNRYPSIIHYLNEQEIPYSSSEYAYFLTKLEEDITQQLYAISILQYYIMSTSNNWETSDESQTQMAFCRHLLQIPPHETLSYEHLSEFKNHLDSAYKEFGYQGLSAEAAKAKYIHTHLNIFGKIYSRDINAQVNALLGFIGSKMVILASPIFLKGFSYIFAKATIHQLQDYRVLFLKKELVRCPSFMMSNPAIVRGHDVFLRQESFDALFYQKWQMAIDPPEAFKYQINSNTVWNISQAIKETTLSLYNVTQTDDLEKARSAFTKDMQDTILKHELGHAVVNDRIFPYENVAIGEGIEHYYKDETFDAILEFLADFSPEKDKLYGPFYNFVQISKKDKNRATRMFYMYLSDVFFYDTADTSMLLYSDLMCLTMLRYIQADKNIDFAKIEKDLSFSGDTSTKTSLFERLHQQYWEYSDHIKILVKKAKYAVSDPPRSYEFVKSVWLNETKKVLPFATVNDKEFLSPFWVNIYSFLDHFSPETAQDVKAYIQKVKIEIVKKIMVYSCGRKVAEQYQFNHRQYIQDRFVELGFKAHL